MSHDKLWRVGWATSTGILVHVLVYMSSVSDMLCKYISCSRGIRYVVCTLDNKWQKVTQQIQKNGQYIALFLDWYYAV